MITLIREWYHRHFSDPQAMMLAMVLLIGATLIYLFGQILTPLLVAVICAYVLEGGVGRLERIGVPRSLAASLVLAFFFFLCLIAIFGLVPLLFQQVTQLFLELPRMLGQGQQQLLRLPEAYPNLFTVDQLNDVMNGLRGEIASFSQAVVSFSVANVVNVFVFAVYFVLVPLVVFFILKDKTMVFGWVSQFLPTRSELTTRVWAEVDAKTASYIRGKLIEIVIIWFVSYVVFALFGLNFSLLLSFLVGISVIIPFVGAFAVTLPVALIAFFQWGLSPAFGYLLFAYAILQILDGNLLVPLLFSEVVNLHPLAIIVAVLFFGGLWGIWGVFFAIPLATLIQALLTAWPSKSGLEPQHLPHAG
ncbi:MAG: AI-2E family transporter [Pseudomonadota bacterium]